jgi:ethanolamine permease
MKRHYEVIFYISLGSGMAFGTSSFMMIAGLFEFTNSLWVVLSVLLAGLACIAIASSVSELASMYPSTPGVRTYLKAAFGNRTSLVLVYLYLIFMILIAGVESYVFALIMTAIVPGVPPMLVVLALLATVIGANVLGLELPRSLQILTTSILVVCIVGMGISGLLLTPHAWSDVLYLSFEDGAAVAQFPAAVGLAVFLFIGFEWVTPLGFGPDSYARKIPLSMPTAIGINMLTYSIFVLGLVAILPRPALVGNSVPHLAYLIEMYGPASVYLAGVLSMLAIFSTFNAGLMGGSRLIFLLTREGNLPQWCGKISLRSGAPIGAIALLGGLAVVTAMIVVTFELELLAAMIGTSFVCVVYSAFMLAQRRLRRLKPDAERPFSTRAPAWAQWLIIVSLPLMGLQALYSERSLPLLIGTLALIGLAFALTKWSIARSRKASPAKRPGFSNVNVRT